MSDAGFGGMTMTEKKPCPEPSHWQSFLAGGEPEDLQSAMNRHLDGCPACQAVLERLVAEGEDWSRLARPASNSLPTTGALPPVLASLKDEGPSGAQ
jgi:hypothetical protein